MPNMRVRPYSKNCVLALFHRLTSLISAAKVFLMIVCYTMVGANLFMWLEVGNDLEAKREALDYHLASRESLLFKFGKIDANKVGKEIFFVLLRVQQVHAGKQMEKVQHWKRAIGGWVDGNWEQTMNKGEEQGRKLEGKTW